MQPIRCCTTLHDAADYDLTPWLAERGMPMMAYSPIEQGRLGTKAVLGEIARAHHVEPLQIALAWVLHRPVLSRFPRQAR